MINIIQFEGTELKIGDKVVDDDRYTGTGVVEEVKELKDTNFPIVVRWGNGNKDTYTLDGRLYSSTPVTLKRYRKKYYKYIGMIGRDYFFITDYYESASDAENLILGSKILREIPESLKEELVK